MRKRRIGGRFRCLWRARFRRDSSGDFGLDRATYDAQTTESGVYIQSTPPDDIAEALKRGNEDVRRAQEATRLMVPVLHPTEERND